ncbi:MAG: twin-arginine translocase TatA/TatE family subunit [Actinomycetia bacterium]|nr:twin-arginine translocase TatA/TatE family subunit [Actinomycetes bacterium]
MTPMFLDLGGGEVFALIVIAVILLGPERVPDLARKAGRVIRFVRNIATNATEQIKTELGPEYADIRLDDLHPRNLVQQVLPPGLADEMTALRGDLAGMRSEIDRLQREATGLAATVSEPLSLEGPGPSVPPAESATAAPAEQRDEPVTPEPEPRPRSGATLLE